MTLLENRALILEDDTELSLTIADFLNMHGFSSVIANSIEQMLQISSKQNFLFYLLDAKLPDGDSFDILSDLRRAGDFTPAIFVTSRTDKNSVLSGFRAGCDDYVKKPFDLDELAAKIKALLRRSYGFDEDGNIEITKDIIFNTQDGLIITRNDRISLTQKEKALLFVLIKNKNRVVSKDEIISELWEDAFSEGALRVYISKLKGALKDSLVCIRGEGYKLDTKR